MAAADGRRVLYREIAQDIRQRIRSGQLAPGDSVGSLDALREAHGAAQNTVRDALRILAAEGMVYTVPGKGTFVTDSAAARESSDSDRIAALERRVDDLAARVDGLTEPDSAEPRAP